MTPARIDVHGPDALTAAVGREQLRESSVRPALHCPSLDGLRGIAILSVVEFHQGVFGFAQGYLGVDLFLVLSGFLITTLLAAEHAVNGQVSLRTFWLRRFLRLAPLYFLYLGLLSIGWTRGILTFDNAEGARHLGSLWLYAYNIAAPDLELYLNEYGISSHLWSLSLEEQFYLGWPFLCVWLLRGGRVRRLSLPLLLALQTTCLELASAPADIAFPPWTRGLSLTAGCTAALALAWYPGFARTLSRAWLQGCCVCALILILTTIQLTKGDLDSERVLQRYLPLLLVPAALLCAALWQQRKTLLSSWLSWPPLAYLGKISYGLYIWHMLCFALATHFTQAGALRTMLAQLLALLVAALCYKHYEQPFSRLKERLSGPRAFQQSRYRVHVASSTRSRHR